MAFEICTLLKNGDEYLPICESKPELIDEDYIEGAIVWRIGDVTLLTTEEWDLVDQLWVYLLKGLEQVLQSRNFETYFPDQPLMLTFTPTSGSLVKVTVDSKVVVVSQADFCASLICGARQFFDEIGRLLPSLKGLCTAQIATIVKLNELSCQK